MNLSSFILGPLFLLLSPKYETIFTDGYNDALLFIERNAKTINNNLRNENHEKEIILSVIFPELLRYSYLIDFFQDRAMEIIYIHYGSSVADFSLGYCQIKPSFVEKMEDYIRRSSALCNLFADIYTYCVYEGTAIRAERIKRIRSFTWQLRYLQAFCAIMEERFNDIRWPGLQEKIAFYASAYNHNFAASKEHIEYWMKQEMYPYGYGYTNNQCSYSQVSLYFYNNNWPQIKALLNAEICQK